MTALHPISGKPGANTRDHEVHKCGESQPLLQALRSQVACPKGRPDQDWNSGMRPARLASAASSSCGSIGLAMCTW